MIRCIGDAGLLENFRHITDISYKQQKITPTILFPFTLKGNSKSQIIQDTCSGSKAVLSSSISFKSKITIIKVYFRLSSRAVGPYSVQHNNL